MSKSEIYLAEAVFRIINERKKQISEALLYDSVKNMEQYRQLMGERKALEYVDDELNYLFFVDFFSILILVDVFILLISFQYTERYSQLIRNTGFIISTILLRLSFSATGLSSIILLISGILFGLIILSIYNQMEKQPKQL